MRAVSRAEKTPRDCLFSSACVCANENTRRYAFLDINPRRDGHTLVVPKEEKQRIADLTPESRAALMEGVVEVRAVHVTWW